MDELLDKPEVCHSAYEKALANFKREYPNRAVTSEIRERVLVAVLDLHRAGQEDVDQLSRYAVTRAFVRQD